MLSLPMAAFPFMFYPEVTASVIIVAVAWRAFTRQPLNRRTAIVIGLGLGYLGWLHIRFLVVAGVALGWVLWCCRPMRRVALLLIGAFALVMASLCAYSYHLTGSLLPSAPFALGVGSGYVGNRVPVGLIAMAIDRMYGLLPLAPFYLLAVPGAGLMAARRPRDLAMIASLALALIIPAAGQGYWTDGSVPWRHALAILPLAAIPIALWLTARGRNAATMAAALVLAAISIRTAAVYNYQNDKAITTLLDGGFSGWDLSLLSPVTGRVRADPMSADAWQMIVVLAALATLFAYGALSDDRTALRRPSVAGVPRALAAALVLLIVIGCASIALGGPAHRSELLRGYRPPPPKPLAMPWFEVGQRPRAPWD
jgi:hypothetical protein